MSEAESVLVQPLALVSDLELAETMGARGFMANTAHVRQVLDERDAARAALAQHAALVAAGERVVTVSEAIGKAPTGANIAALLPALRELRAALAVQPAASAARGEGEAT